MKLNKKKRYNRILTFGAFNPIHFGHIYLFKETKKRCNQLVVCVSDDNYIRKVKNSEPFFNFKERCEYVKSIRYVDIVDKQSLDFSKEDAVKKYSPDALAVGQDWQGCYTGEGLGIPVIYIPRIKGMSSTILRRELNRLMV